MALCSNESMRAGRILALDFGERNIGLACTDELGVTVRPLPSLRHISRRSLLDRLGALVREMNIVSIVVGMPLNMDGTPAAAAERVAGFIHLLEAELGLPLSSVDERLTTMEAMEIWRQMNSRQKRRYRTADSLAAALILKRHLEGS